MTSVHRKQLHHLFEVVSGATPKIDESEYWDGSILWVTPKDISSTEGYWIRDTRRKITAAGYESCRTTIVPPDSIVLTKRSPIGNVSVLAKDACSNQACFLLVPRQEIDTRFYYYWLLAQTNHLQMLGRGSVFQELRADELRSLSLPHPSLRKQNAVADYLDCELSRSDALVGEQERVIGLLAERRQAVISRAVTRGLDPFASFRDSGLPWLGKIPSEWETRRVAWLFRQRDERGEADLPLLEVSINSGVSVRQFSADRIENTAADYNTYKIARRGDVVFNRMRMWQGAVGSAPQDGLVSPDYVVAVPNGALLPQFAGLLFRTAWFSAECARRSHGIVWDRLRLYWGRFRDIEVPVPPIKDQQAIAGHVAEAIAKVDALIFETKRTIVLLRERRKALIAAALADQIELGGAP